MTEPDAEYRRKLMRGAIIFGLLALLGLAVFGLAAARYFFGVTLG